MIESKAALPVVVIQPRRGWVAIDFSELWAYRELLGFLVWRSVKVRYAQTVLGFAWAILQPLATMVVFTIFFGKLAKIPSDGVPYPIFSYAALVPWTFFANGITAASGSLVANQSLLKRVYFPRLITPIAAVFSGLVDFIIAMAMLWVLMAWYGFGLSLRSLWVVPLLALAIITSLGVGFWLSALNVRFRDIRYAVPFLVQLWLFSTPIAYPSTLLEEPWRTLYGINPMVGVVEGFRWSLLGTTTQPGPIVILSSLVAVAILVSGAYWFRRLEKTFADIV